MNAAQRKRRMLRLAALEEKAFLIPAELYERDWLIGWRDTQWRTLPRRIDTLRARLAALCDYADEIGLGPC